MNKKAIARVFLIASVFMLGFLASNIYAQMNIESPLKIAKNVTKTFDGTNDDQVPSPSDWIKENQISVYNSQVVLDLQNAQWATFTDTHSMEPVLSARANAIEVVPKSPDEIKIGDIVSYKSDYADGTIIHRVVEKNVDDQGIYFTMKGDNNQASDPGKIRFDQVRRVVVAIVY